jgi:adenylate cyclase
MSGEEVTRRLAAILAADIVGYSRMIGSDEAGTVAALKKIWADSFNPKVAKFHGRIVKMMGDGALVEFGSVVDAVNCALEFQRAMTERNAKSDRQVTFRVGINLGDIIIDGDDIMGDGVNIAARLEAKAPAGGILISQAVNAETAGKIDSAFIDGGEIKLKNIEKPVRVWRWPGEDTASRPARATAETTSARKSDMPSIAVLPFENMSPDPDQEFFADGLVEDIITTLSKLRDLTVIARNSTFVYKGRSVDVRKVAEELGIRYVLEGSVRKSGNRIRITAQLVDAESGNHVWAERYDRNVEDIFELQDEITLVLATELQANLSEGEQARLRYTTTTNVEAWNCWAQGSSYMRRPISKDHWSEALRHVEKALALDPDSAALNATMALFRYADARFGWWDARETALNKANAHVQTALAKDPQNGEAHLVAGLLSMLQKQFDQAVAEGQRAVELSPGSADIRMFASFILACAGRPEDALTQIKRAIQLHPNHPPAYFGHLGNALRLSGHYGEAVEAFTAYHERNPGFGLADLVLIYWQTGQSDQARQAAQQLMELRPGFTVSSWLDTQFRNDALQLEADIEALKAAGLPT